MLNVLKWRITAGDDSGPVIEKHKQKLGEIKGALRTVADTSRKTGKAMRNIGVGITVGATAPLAFLGKQSVQLYDQQLKAQKAVEVAIKSTGGAAGFAADELFKQASALQEIGVVGDEDILQNVTAPLLTFTKVSGDAFERAQKATLNMSALLGTDLRSAALQVGKALNDPVKGVTALSRAGVQLTEGQIKMIKTMTEVGDVAGAQAVILGELETQFGGQMEALADAPLGAMRQLSNAIGDVKEQLGAQIVPFLVPLVQRVKEGVAWFGALDPEVKKNIVVFGGLAAAAGPVIAILGTAVLGVTALIGAVGLLASPILLIGGAIAAVAAGALAIYNDWGGVGTWFGRELGRVKGHFQDWAAWLAGQFGSDQQAARDMVDKVWAGVPEFYASIWDVVKADSALKMTALRSIIADGLSFQAIGTLLGNPISRAIGGMTSDALKAMEAIGQVIWAEIATWPGKMVQLGRDTVDGFVDGLLGGVGKIKSSFTEIFERGKQAFKDAAGIQSPSKVFRALGLNIGEGLGLGIADSTDGVVAQVEDLAGAIEDAAGKAKPAEAAFKNMFASIVTGGTKARDALSNLLGNIGNQWVNKGFDTLFGAIPFDTMFGGVFGALFPSAQGNVFDGGNVVPFARGGAFEAGNVVSAPTVFPMISGQTGLMGEAGPEAIMPLKRIGGRLGVSAEGMGMPQMQSVRNDPVRIELVVGGLPEGVTIEQSRSIATEQAQIVSVQVVSDYANAQRSSYGARQGAFESRGRL